VLLEVEGGEGWGRGKRKVLHREERGGDRNSEAVVVVALRTI
jgi:hypothetical protein